MILVVSSCNGQVQSTDNTHVPLTPNSNQKLPHPKNLTSGNIGCELQDRAYDGKAFFNFLPGIEYYNNNRPTDDGNALSSIISENYFPTSENIADDMIFSMTEDKEGNIWFATRDHGVCVYDGKVFTTIWQNEGFRSRGAHNIIEDENGIMWFITGAEGVWRYDGNSFINYTTKDGLVNNSVFSAFEDQEGNLWFGTRNFGLSRFDGKTFITLSE